MKIITKYQNGRKYYYLRLGFRRNKKVITRDKYLGKKLPPEVEINKIKKILLQERNLDLNNKLKVIKENFQKEWRTFPESIKEKELQEISIAFTYNTNAIEGSTITF